jgi:Bacterial pre-peptidase C-terminal domain
MTSRIVRVSLLTILGSLAAVFVYAGALAVTPVPESEPNDTPATADPISFVAGCGVMSGSIIASDVDYFSFAAPAGSRVWAFVDTSASPTFLDDSILTLFDTNGTTQLEQDDDDATATNCGTTEVNPRSSAIAGRVLTAGGTYFLQVSSFLGSLISSYRLTVVVTSTSSSETEPNDSAATANAIVTSGSLIGVRTGAIGTPTDFDYYSVVAPAGSTLFISADANPERDATGTDVVVDLIQPDGSTVIITVDGTTDTGFPSPPSEVFCYNVPISGTYFVRVHTPLTKTTTGTYSLMVAACGVPATPTPTPTLTNTVVVGGPTSTPTPTRTATATPTATVSLPTATRTFTPIGGVPPPSDIPTLSFPMFAVMGLGLVGAAFLILRRF